MTPRWLLALVTLLAFNTLALTQVQGSEGDFDRDGSYRTNNFRVYAPTRELAEKFGDMAEHYRREKALEWLGEVMPNWPQRCPLTVKVTTQQPGGATTFTFSGGPDGRSSVTSQEMKIWGETKQLLYSVLPHEVTHTVLAYHFGQAVPRWADEGGSVLSENEDEWFSHDIRCRELLNAGRGIPLRVLFTLKEYPKDMIVVYAQGYSICDYLINQHGGRQKFLKFVRLGMRNGNRNWEQAVQQMYQFESVDELQEKWIDSLRVPPSRAAKVRPKANDSIALASRNDTRGPDIRTSSLGGVPRLEPPLLARGAMSDRDERSARIVEAKPTVRPTDSPPPTALLLPPEYAPRK